MATLRGKTLFFTTSPRSPMKMIPELELLVNNFSGKEWTEEVQEQYIILLSKNENFLGEGFGSDLAFSARDRINRAPKALGFINLKPNIQITDAGKALITSNRKEEVLLRQLLKFQLPSPYHKNPENNQLFFVKPYLEIIRLIYQLKSISFDELMIFGMQLTNFKNFDKIVNKIELFRQEKILYKGTYKTYFQDQIKKEILQIFNTDIREGRLQTRESNIISLDNFIKTKRNTLRDYTDACFRYLRATGLFSISHKGRTISIMSDKINDVRFIVENTKREPILINEENEYKKYLFDSKTPQLYTDNWNNLEEFITKNSNILSKELKDKTTEQLKDIRDEIICEKREKFVISQVDNLKSYSLYSEVIDTYNEIISDNLYDVPLMFEWNTWRAMTMLDGGVITGNFKIDDEGQPLSTATGNIADIVCDYGKFGLTVEVTMQSGQRQYEAEGEPVARHLAKYKEAISKDAYCLFIAPRINEACIAHFYTLSKTNISYYGGKSIIIPIPLEIFMKMIEESYAAKFVPTPEYIQKLFLYAKELAEVAKDEKDWYNSIIEKAKNWLTA